MARAAKRFLLTALIFIAAVVVLLALYKTYGNIDYPRDTVARADLLGLQTQLQIYKKMAGFYPSTAQGLKALVARPTSSPIPEHWYQLYSDLPTDPWRHPFVYRFPDPRNPTSFDLFSLGPDGVESDDDVREPH